MFIEYDLRHRDVILHAQLLLAIIIEKLSILPENINENLQILVNLLRIVILYRNSKQQINLLEMLVPLLIV